jgi:HTH-type transcriptional regulator/antitoxin HigA
MGRTVSEVNFIMVGRKRLSPEIAQELSVVFGNSPDYWLGLENAYRLSQTEYVDESVVRRSLLFSFPIKDMQKRGWISDTLDIEQLEDELKRFFGVPDLSGDIPLTAAYKRTNKESLLNPAEKTWVARAKQLARACPAASYDERNIALLETDLRRFASKSKAVHRVPEILARYGIRYVVVEPIPRVQIDGAAFWLNETSPVIAMSIRFDNIGSFWFTLIHEVIHIKHKDEFSFDDLESAPNDEAEIRANREAAEILVPQDQLQAFIKTYSPRYSEAVINNLATRLHIHPGIIVGQLQHRKEIGYQAHRKLMAKVRELATTIAFTDGWGHPIPQV